MNQEIWKTIDEYNNYEISCFGRVRNNKSFKILKPYYRGSSCIKYYTVRLYNNGIKKDYSVHRLVAFAFIPNYKNYDEVDHLDRNPLNNNYDNLRWVNSSINNKNKNIQCNNKSGTKGVYFDKHRNKYVGQGVINNKVIYKRFNTMEEAIEYRTNLENEINYND